jgi:glycosyltransferase involved in cell wall biosynthesis
MRVLMTADAVGGVWPYAADLAGLLTAHGGSVMLATMGPEPSADQRAMVEAIPRVTLRARRFALEWMPDPWTDIECAADWLLELEAEFTPDVIHLNGYAHATLPWRAPTLVVAHSCVCSWWAAVRNGPVPAEWTEYVRRVAAGLRAATAVAAPSQAMACTLAECYGNRRPVAVIPNARDAARWAPDTKESMILAAGRLWDPAKNIAVLDAAAEALEWPVYVAGDGVDANGKRVALSRLRTLGVLPADDLASLMARAAIYAFPARYEPFGLSVLEAALSGCALVLGDIPSLRENWEGVARFVPPEQPDALRRALQELIDDPPQRAALGIAARRRGERFSPAAHVHAYERIYHEMVTTHGRLADSSRSL